MVDGNTLNAHFTLHNMNEEENKTVYGGIVKNSAQVITLRPGDIVYRFASKHDARPVDAGPWWVGHADFERVLTLETEMHRLVGRTACLGLGFVARVVLDIHWEWNPLANWLVKARVNSNMNVVVGRAARHPWEPFTLKGIENQILLALSTITESGTKSDLPPRHGGQAPGTFLIDQVLESLEPERRCAQTMAPRLKNAQQAVKHIYIPNVCKGGSREGQVGIHETKRKVCHPALTVVGSPRPIRSYPYELPYGCGDGFRSAVTS